MTYLTSYLLRFLIVIVFASFATAAAMADEEKPQFFTFTFENDTFVGKDDGYTNGVGITVGRGPFAEFNDENLPNWMHTLTRRLYIRTMPDKQRGIAHMFFQRMQTPEDITVSELIEDDLPYAGLLAWQGTMYAWDERVADQFSLYLGVVGPVALAEQAQKIVHQLVGADDPKGWDNQIENEPVFKVEAQRVWNLYRFIGERFEFDVLGLAGAGIGTLESATKGGLAIRWGTNLQASYAAFSLQADRQVNPLALTPKNDFYLYLGARAGLVFNDILIDGNTFRDSHSAPLEHYQDQVSAGAVWALGPCAFVFQLSSFSSPTMLINDRTEYGAFGITYRY